MDEDNSEGRVMARKDAGDGEGGDTLASVTGTCVVYLFDRNGDERGDTASSGQRRGGGKRRKRRAMVEVGVGGLGR